ncbi:hypothetical protein V6N13_004740 [Hibiscus sabdariffa]|uniref:Uncharacterized protein n=1 Tax=Hibiscus sabdariffa TaxID=183260 RepID=A0ABR2RZF4_9ROSI
MGAGSHGGAGSFASGVGVARRIGELVAVEAGEREDIHVPLIEWKSVAAQQSQEFELGSKSPKSLIPIESSNLELGDTEIVLNQ